MTKAAKSGKRDHVFLVDGSSYIFRAYFAMFKAAQARGKSFTRSDGLPVGAVMTFCNMLWKLLREGLDGVKPTHIGVIFDASGESFRNEIYPKYKANRDEPPEDLIPQFPLMREAVKGFGFVPIEEDGFEADDLIATYARAALAHGADVTIVAAKDLMQLVRPGVAIATRCRAASTGSAPRKSGSSASAGKGHRVQSRGDSTDNVPGVPGIGVKTAAQLIGEYGDLSPAEAGERDQTGEASRVADQVAEQAHLRKLVTLDDRHRFISLRTCISTASTPSAIAFLKAMELTLTGAWPKPSTSMPFDRPTWRSP
jgi:DNA polymerase-1